MKIKLNWKLAGLAVAIGGVAVGLIGALRYGNRYLDLTEDFEQEDLAVGEFFTCSKGWRLHYTASGEGSPLVLIHGFMDSHRSWRRNVEEWSRNHKVYAIDVLGFGSSDRVKAPVYTLKHQAALLNEFLDANGIACASIVGHSMGGALALQFAYDFPEKVHKLVLIAPATYLYSSFPQNGISGLPPSVARGLLGIASMLGANGEMSVRAAYGEPARVKEEAVTMRAQLLKVKGTGDALVSMSRSRRETDMPAALSKIQVPTLLVWGERDRVVPRSHAHRHFRELPNVELVFVSEAGHLPHEEYPSTVNAIVNQFLDG